MATVIGAAQNLGVKLNGGDRCIVRTSGGGIYVVGVDSVADPEAIAVWYSADGVAFAEKDNGNRPTASGAGAEEDGVVCAIDSSDIIHIFWHAEADEEYNYTTFATATDQWNGGNPANVVTIAIDDDTRILRQQMVSIAIDSNDIPHVVYIDSNSVKGINYDTVFYNNRIGGAWNGAGLEIEGQATSKKCHRCCIAINDADIPVVFYWNETDSVVTAVKGNQNDANDFSTARDIDTPGIWNGGSIAVDSNGDVWVAYVEDDNNFLSIAKQSVNWTDPWTITDDGDDAETDSMSLAIDGTTEYIFYEEPTDNDIKYNRYTGAWLGETGLQIGTQKWARARWSYLNNPLYSTYGIDYVWEESDDMYWDRLVIAVAVRRIFITHV